MMDIKTAYDVWLCTDCTLVTANGECGEDPECEPLNLIPDYAHVTLGRFWEHHDDTCPNRAAGRWVDECDCETIAFHSRDCDGCGALPGERHAATVWPDGRL